MKKILALAVALSATALMACPMGQGKMGQGGMCRGGMMEKCQCDTKQLPRMLEALELSDKQKEQIVQLRAETQAFHNKQHDKMMGILSAEQRGKLEYARQLRGSHGYGKKHCAAPGDGMGMKGGMRCQPSSGQ